ncbi:zinc finger protein 570-like [Microplitis mediator]|uniref:zinc finger protein 570-like n=1 Tax=Microplitis mediator TaxID=375433 RepID=UPI0025543DA9|nr:zinc finger protein 570-like [Microplitis mediator]
MYFCAKSKFKSKSENAGSSKHYPCAHCHRSYRNKSSLTRHIQYECGQYKQYMCPICHKRLQNSSLYKHMLLHKQEGALISILRSSFGSKTSKYSLKKSLSTASIESRSPRSVDESVSESGSSLRRERSSREVVFPDSFEVLPQPRDLTYVGLPHEQQRKFRCRFCGKGYRWKSTMRRHETVECGGKPPAFQCPECPYKARQRAEHQQQLSDEDIGRVYPCAACGRNYRRMISLQRHQRLECGKEAQFECIICHAKFKHKHSLLRHYRIHLSFAGVDEKLNPALQQQRFV